MGSKILTILVKSFASEKGKILWEFTGKWKSKILTIINEKKFTSEKKVQNFEKLRVKYGPEFWQ